MRDLLVITPTRGRPDRVARLVSSIGRTSTLRTDIVLGLDEDDETAVHEVAPFIEKYDYAQAMIGPRQGLGPWTNQIAQAHFGDYRAFASLGDDHVPRTLGWDAECLRAIDSFGGEQMGGGFAAPNGHLTPGFPEQIVISANIVEALGWMCLPGLDHWYVDQVWYDLARVTHRYAWLENVAVEHWQDASDATGAEAWSSIDRDRVIYATWLLEGYGADVETVRKAVGG